MMLFAIFAQRPAFGKSPAGQDLRDIKTVRSELIAKPSLSELFSARARKDPALQKIYSSLDKRGLKGGTADKDYFGAEETFVNAAGDSLEASFYLRGFSQAGSKAVGAAGILSVSAYGQSQIYYFLWYAPNGKLGDTIESRIDKKLHTERTHGAFKTIFGSLKKTSPDLLERAQSTCPGASWTEYFDCIARMGSDGPLKAIACAGCDCHWWCVWAVGCCER